MPRCTHFNGILNGKCEAGLPYEPAHGFFPCTGGPASTRCDGYTPLTAEEQALEEADFQVHMATLRRRKYLATGETL